MKEHLSRLAVFSLAAVTGCMNMPSVGPDYVEPEVDVSVCALPDAGVPTDANADERIVISEDGLARWWERMNDPVLTELVESAVTSNLTFRAAVSRLEQANWELLGAFSAFMPKMSVDGEISRTETHRNVSTVGAPRHKETDVFKGG